MTDPIPLDPEVQRKQTVENCDGGRMREPEVERTVLEAILEWWDQNPDDLPPESGRDRYRARLHHKINKALKGYLNQHDIQPGSLTWTWYVGCAAAQHLAQEPGA